jgi:arylsulfatase A-like enzyme
MYPKNLYLQFAQKSWHLFFPLIGISVIFISCKQKVKSEKQPNIVWIVFEDMSPQFIGAYGNEAARTPVMDSLINEGTRFNAAFSTNAVCSPSRYTLITGTRTNEYGTGHHRSNYPIPETVKPFPLFLKEAGYYTSNNSKKDYNTSARMRITEEAWTESSATAGWWNREGNQPFFSVFNFNNSHQSRTFTNPYNNYKERILDKLSENEIISDEDIILPDYYKDTPDLRKELARTYNALVKTDNEIDTLITRLKKEDLLESTIIFIYSDHGGGALRTKTKGLALGHQVPLAIIVPEAYQHLNPFAQQKSTQQPVTFEDFAPTVLSLAGLTKPTYMTGKPFLGTVSDKQELVFSSTDRSGDAPDLTRSVSDGRYFYTRVFMPSRPQYSWQKYFDYSASRQLIRQYHAKGTLTDIQNKPFAARPQEFLYDLTTDIWQTNNLAQDKQYKAILTKLRTALDEKLLTIKDAHFMPEYLLDSIAKITTPFEYKNSSSFDFEAIYHIAKLVGSGSASLPTQLNALRSSDPIVRYWAAMGLYHQPEKDLEPQIKLLEEAINDDFPPVNIILASILNRITDSELSEEVIRKYLHHKNDFLAAQSLQEVVYLPKPKGLAFLKDVQQLADIKRSGMITESIDIYLYLYLNKPLSYETHW